MIALTAEPRDIFGKELATERLAGRLPAVAYGGKKLARPLFVDIKEFKKVLVAAGESTLVTVKIGAGHEDVLIHEVAHHPVSGEPIHVDFLIVDTAKPIKVHVPLEFEGIAPAIKDFGGALVKVLHELEVEALPKNLPHDIKVDVSVLIDLDSQIHVRDLILPPGVQTEVEPGEVVASVTVAGEEVKEEEVPVDLSAIEVEQKGKTEEAEGEATVAEPTK